MNFLKKVTGSIQFTREGDQNVVTINMTVGTRKSNNQIYIFMPLFGGLETYCDEGEDMAKVIEGTLKHYFDFLATKGIDLIRELKSLGWEQKRNKMRFREVIRKDRFGNSNGKTRMDLLEKGFVPFDVNTIGFHIKKDKSLLVF